MQGLGGVGFQEVVHQRVQQHGASLWKGSSIFNRLVCLLLLRSKEPDGPTGAELVVDEAPDLFELLEVGGLQEREEVPDVGLLPGHGGSAGGGGRVSLTVSVPACLEDSWGPPTNTVSRHRWRVGTKTQSQKQVQNVFGSCSLKSERILETGATTNI